jgi:hypothetical protein
MKLSPHEREQLRLSLLRFLDNNASGRGMSTGLLLQMARSEGRPRLITDDVDAELQYLADKGLIAQVSKAVSPEIVLWRITATGRDFQATSE